MYVYISLSLSIYIYIYSGTRTDDTLCPVCTTEFLVFRYQQLINTYIYIYICI